VSTWVEAGDGEGGEAAGGVAEDESALNVHHLQKEVLPQPPIEPGPALNLGKPRSCKGPVVFYPGQFLVPGQLPCTGTDVFHRECCLVNGQLSYVDTVDLYRDSRLDSDSCLVQGDGCSCTGTDAFFRDSFLVQGQLSCTGSVFLYSDGSIVQG
jgi:hypothetical protein